MTGEDRSRSEEIRALIEEVDRVRNESEHVCGQADRAMKHPFWPERRGSLRIPGAPKPSDPGERA